MLDYEKIDQPGLRAARRYARWRLGDGDWADRILNAYFNPESIHEYINAEQGED